MKLITDEKALNLSIQLLQNDKTIQEELIKLNNSTKEELSKENKSIKEELKQKASDDELSQAIINALTIREF